MSLRHSLLALLVVVIWGANFVVIDAGQADVPPLLFLALRFLVVCVPAVFFLKPPGIGWRQLLLVGGFLSLGQFALLYLALALGMPPGLASLLLQTQVMFSLAVAAVVLRERPTRRQLVGVLIGMAGLAVVITAHTQAAPLLPLVVTLGAALAWSIGNVLARRAQATSGLSLVVWSGLVVPLPAFALSLIVDSPPVVWEALTSLSWVAVGSTVYTAVFASLIGYGIWNSLLARYPTSAVVPFTLLVPVVGILTAWLVQGEVPAVAELVGGAVMLAGLAAAVLRPRRAVPPAPLAPKGKKVKKT
ncbi:EamA family transporter [Microcella frigidaquae]|uniref:O-acetylserine/cysteine efflux transporter n=1 Tax=Microcella frigidaquae TaxID=424758 RepID=A0A840XKG2_9MICO|nr:O-acetylserine/cysteine efflux transporter [Microcella frigidaquae]NHN44196.1 EamA family transporter [Microcella frigidaquae]